MQQHLRSDLSLSFSVWRNWRYRGQEIVAEQFFLREFFGLIPPAAAGSCHALCEALSWKRANGPARLVAWNADEVERAGESVAAVAHIPRQCAGSPRPNGVIGHTTLEMALKALGQM